MTYRCIISVSLLSQWSIASGSSWLTARKIPTLQRHRLRCVKAKCPTLLSSVEPSHLSAFRSVEALRNKEEALQNQDRVQVHEVKEAESKPVAIVVSISFDSTPWQQLIGKFSELFDESLPNADELKSFVQYELPAKINVSFSDLATWTCYSGDAEFVNNLFEPNDVALCTEFMMWIFGN